MLVVRSAPATRRADVRSAGGSSSRSRSRPAAGAGVRRARRARRPGAETRRDHHRRARRARATPTDATRAAPRLDPRVVRRRARSRNAATRSRTSTPRSTGCSRVSIGRRAIRPCVCSTASSWSSAPRGRASAVDIALGPPRAGAAGGRRAARPAAARRPGQRPISPRDRKTVNRTGRSGVYRRDADSTSCPRSARGVAVGLPEPIRPGDRPIDAVDTIDLTVVHVDPARDFETFYRDGYADIARALTVTLGNLDLAQEATDEAMVRAYARWDKIGAYDNPGGWVYRVGLNWARSTRRRLHHRVVPFHERRVSNAPHDRSRERGRVAGPRRQPARGRRVSPPARLVRRRNRDRPSHQARHREEPAAPRPHPTRTNPWRCLVSDTPGRRAPRRFAPRGTAHRAGRSRCRDDPTPRRAPSRNRGRAIVAVGAARASPGSVCR